MVSVVLLFVAVFCVLILFRIVLNMRACAYASMAYARNPSSTIRTHRACLQSLCKRSELKQLRLQDARHCCFWPPQSFLTVSHPLPLLFVRPLWPRPPSCRHPLPLVGWFRIGSSDPRSVPATVRTKAATAQTKAVPFPVSWAPFLARGCSRSTPLALPPPTAKRARCSLLPAAQAAVEDRNMLWRQAQQRFP